MLRYDKEAEGEGGEDNEGRGVINGAEWYAVWGSLSDWAYGAMGVPFVTVELGLDDVDGESMDDISMGWDRGRERDDRKFLFQNTNTHSWACFGTLKTL